MKGKLIPLSHLSMTDVTNGEVATWGRHCLSSLLRVISSAAPLSEMTGFIVYIYILCLSQG